MPENCNDCNCNENLNHDCGCNQNKSICNACNNVESDCNCPYKDMSTDCIIYKGDDLPCSGIEGDKQLTEVLQEIDKFLCDKYLEIINQLSIKNVGAGKESYIGPSNIGEKMFRTFLKSSSIFVVQRQQELSFKVNIGWLERTVISIIKRNPSVITDIFDQYIAENPNVITDVFDTYINQNPDVILDVIRENPNVIKDIIQNDSTIFDNILQDYLNDNPDILRDIISQYLSDNPSLICDVDCGQSFLTVYTDGNKTITLPTNSASSTATVNVSSGGSYSLNWVKTSGPSTFNISNPNSASTSFANLVEGTYVFTVTVTDGALTDSATVTINVNPEPINNNPPTNVTGIALSNSACCDNLAL